MPDQFEDNSSGLDSPASDAFAIAPADGADLAQTVRAIYVGGAGDISLVTKGGTTLTFTGLQAGSILPVRAARVRLTSTTATGLIGMV